MHHSPLEVLYEDNHLIAVNKPPLIPTMGVAADQASMVTWVKDYLGKRYRKPGNVYLGVVSRLDAWSRGVLLFARTSKAAARLTRQFGEGEVDKIYWAITESVPEGEQGSMNDWLVKDDRNRRMMTTGPHTADARQAELHWRLLGHHAGQGLVEVRLVTGRKHQIRVQFSRRGWPLAGDRKYGGQLAFEGIGLLAKSLSLEHPVRREPLVLEIEPPADWKIHRFRDI